MSYDLIPTPNPNEFAVRVWVSAQQVMSKLSALVAGTTTLKQMDLATAPVSEGFGDYIYTKCEGPDGQGRLGLYFAKNKTETEKHTPFNTMWLEQGPHPWAGIVNDFELQEDHEFTLSTNIVAYGNPGIATGPTYRERYDYVQPVNDGSRFLLKEYFAATAFNIKRNRTPIATTVKVSVNGLDVTIPDVLTDEIEIPDTRSATARHLENVGQIGGSGHVPGRTIPRTNFKGWLVHVKSAQQVWQSGGYYLRVIYVYPPLRPRRIPR